MMIISYLRFVCGEYMGNRRKIDVCGRTQSRARGASDWRSRLVIRIHSSGTRINRRSIGIHKSIHWIIAFRVEDVSRGR